MSYHARQILSAGALKKRKEREEREAAAASYKRAEPRRSNQLLAGYMAHEFLTKGTLLGEKWDPAKAESGSVLSGLMKPSNGSREAEPKRESYADVAGLLKGDGAHVAGVVNPTQLGRWIQM